MGRPSTYSAAITETICEQLAAGKSLRAICKQDGIPAMSTVMVWLAEHKDFQEQYARAREIGLDMLAEEALEIADTPVEGIRTKVSAEGTETTTEDMLGHRKLQVDTRKWFLSKLAPKKYGDKQTLEHTGPENGPVQVEHKATALAAILNAAAARKAQEDNDLDGLV